MSEEKEECQIPKYFSCCEMCVIEKNGFKVFYLHKDSVSMVTSPLSPPS